MEQLGSHWTDFHEIWFLRIFKNLLVSLKPDITGTWHENLHIFEKISQLILL